MADPIKPSQHSAEPYQGLGSAEYDLKSIRESKGLTLRDIFEQTRISVTNLAAIENGDFHLLPPPVITKSFIKIYAKALGLDGDDIMARYEQYLEALNPTQRDVKIKEVSKSTRMFYKVSSWGLLIVIAVSLVIFSLSTYESLIDVVKNQAPQEENKRYSLKTTDAVEKTPTSEAPAQTNVTPTAQEGNAQSIPPVQAQTSIPEAQEKEKMKEGTTPEDTSKNNETSGETYQVTMEAKELTWLRITADNNPPYEILLQPGEKIERDASRFIIDVGNAGGIEITFQGKSLGSLGERGQVVHLKLPQNDR